MALERSEDSDRIAPNLRALMILEVLADAGRPLTPTEINDSLQLPKPTIHRLCRTLLEQGFLSRDVDTNRLRPASRLRTIAAGVMNSSRIQIARRSVMTALAEAVGETCNLSVPDADGMIYVDRVETSWPMRFQLPVGSSVPFHCTASGKLFLSTLAPARLDNLLSAIKLDALAKNTYTDPNALKEELARIRAAGFARDNEEFIDNLIALAVPIPDPSDRLFAVLAFHGPVQRMSMEEAEAHLPDLRRAAMKLSEIIFGETS